MRRHVVRHDVGSPAYWLAIGSAGTANDLARISKEFERLADNFLQLAEMAASEWDASKTTKRIETPPSKKHRISK